MSYICSIGTGIPEFEINQQEIKSLVKEIFVYPKQELNRLLPVFDHAKISKRQFVVDKNWFKEQHDFKERNELYQELACKYSLAAIDECLTNKQFLQEEIPFESIDMFIFVSSTGIATPSLETHIINKRPFRNDICRMPLWGLGCAGGAIALSRGSDWVRAYPDKTVLIVCAELCSLTFQINDLKKSNLIGTALFGDGTGAILMCGNKSPLLSNRIKPSPQIIRSSSLTKRESLSVMGWNITNHGLEVVFSKSIPDLISSFWDEHITSFLQEVQLGADQIHSFIAHPGGKKVLEAMKNVLHIPDEKLVKSYQVLTNHGNMSSATVFYVLKAWMQEKIERNRWSILSALGPGFSSELLLMEWN